jgi:prefoldin beta subunit
MSTLVTARQKLESQQQENKGVQKVRDQIFSKEHTSKRLLTTCQEFNSLADDANIYKLVGPVLLKQDTTEAKSTVDGRLEYIGGEMYECTNQYHLRSGRMLTFWGA